MTAAPSISELFSDSLEFQLVVPTFGIAHPTGYPLYTLLGGLWSNLLFPFGNWAWRMNLFSALVAGISVGLICRLGQKLGKKGVDWQRILGGLTAALILMHSPLWWSQATIAEVYPLHNLFVVALLLAALSFRAALSKRSFGFFLLLGFSLTHHRTIVLLLPALLIYLSWTNPRLWQPQRYWPIWMAATLTPLLLYLYLPLRAAMGIRDLHGDYVNSWAGFWRHVLALGYSGFLSGASAQPSLDWAQLLPYVHAQVGWLALALALFGAIVGWSERCTRPQTALTAAGLLVNLLFALNYRVGDAEVFLLPCIVSLAALAVIGMNWLLQRAASVFSPRIVFGFGVALLVLLPIEQMPQLLPLDRSQDWAIHDYAVALAKTDFPLGSRLIGLEGEISALKYMQQAEALGMAATPVVADDEETRRAAIAHSLAVGAPTYITREIADIATRYSFSGEGVLVRVWPRGQAQVDPPQHPLDVVMAEDSLHLTGFDLTRLEQAGGRAWQLGLYWRPARALAGNFKLSLRWLDAQGNSIALNNSLQGFDEFPLRQVALASTWLPGEIVRDVHLVRQPAQAAPSPAALLVIVYDAESGLEMGRWQTILPV
jgi:hypothetical protein